MPLLDLTHTIRDKMPVYPGDTIPEIAESGTVEQGGIAHYDLKLGTHVGTHIDGPAHMIAGGRKLCEFSIDHFMGKAKIVHVPNQPFIKPEHLENINIETGDIILFRTDWSQYFHSPDYFENYPVLTPELANYLVGKGVKMIGLDTPSPDTAPFEIHKILLKNEILIIENLTNLDQIPKAVPFELIALPLKVEADSAPARVIAKI